LIDDRGQLSPQPLIQTYTKIWLIRLAVNRHKPISQLRSKIL
jgi:hypothetical protein